MTTPFTAEEEAWIASRPPAVAAKVRAYPPTQPYWLTTTNQKVWIYSYATDEHGACETCTIIALAAENPTTLNARLVGDVGVFGIPFHELVPWSAAEPTPGARGTRPARETRRHDDERPA